ncbi:Cilia- and flagella-associated protein 53 [Borealophlyctis nickersoniae]|nr:Cilia- and flagella-associated protein 53 [Borealophlyctis nickersoniae]
MRSDYLITNRRREEHNRQKMLEQTQYYAQTSAQSHFEASTTAAIRRSHILRRFEELKSQELGKLEERREKLRQLLRQDEERYRAELLNKEETRESRVEMMRARMNELKSKREEERKRIVEEKLLQKWRNECDDLRAIESRILEKEVAEARSEQLLEHAEKAAIAAQEKKYYDELWELDRQKKIQREEEDRARTKAMNEAMVATLDEQLHMLKIQAREEERLKQEEAELMRQDHEMQILEHERAQLRKLQDQRQVRLELDMFNRAKIQQRQLQIKEALEMDMKIVNEFFRLDEKEREDKSRRKEELRKEMQLYREHLLEQKRIEREREKEIEKLHKEEEDKLWRLRAEKWRKEQLARDRLMEEVLSGRKEQLRFALDQNRIRLEQTQQERQELEQQIAQAKAAEVVERDRVKRAAQDYQSSLLTQMAVVEDRKRLERLRRDEEAIAEKEAEERYREMLRLETDRAVNLPRIRAFRASNKEAARAAGSAARMI